jgi:hypothetical protein
MCRFAVIRVSPRFRSAGRIDGCLETSFCTVLSFETCGPCVEIYKRQIQKQNGYIFFAMQTQNCVIKCQ